jgi:hypothetical protein
MTIATELLKLDATKTAIAAAISAQGVTVGAVPFATYADLISARGVASLFDNGEQGAWYDPSDMATLFQDSAGTIPVTAVEQPVGLMLDKSKGLVLGPELATPLTPANWSVAGADATHIVTFASNTIRYQSGTTTPILSVSMVASLPLPIGTYEVKVITSSYVSGAIKVFETASSKLVVNGIGSFKGLVTVTSTGGSAFIFTRDSSNVDLTISSISIRKLEGNHALQPTSANRPVLKQDANGKRYLSFNGTTQSMSTAAINFSATDKMMVCAGVRKLSDAATGMVVELSSVVATNQGSFYLTGPSSANGNNYAYLSRGSIDSSSPAISTGAQSPNTSVLTGVSNISAATMYLRRNTAQVSSAGAQGTGNYGNHALFIGARAGTSLYFNGNLYGLLIRGAASSAQQIASAEYYMNTKTGAY